MPGGLVPWHRRTPATPHQPATVTVSRLILLWVLLLTATSGRGQGGVNPFELPGRLPAAGVVDSGRAVVDTGNPFDLRPGVSGAAASTPLAPASAPGELSGTNGPLVIQSADPNAGRGRLLTVHLILLLTLAGLWLLFGNLLAQCFRSTFNDGLMNQLYSRRSGGELGALWACYIFFFFAVGFFVHLALTHLGIGIGAGVIVSWLFYSLTAAAVVGVKNIVLTLYAGVFPVRREVSRYIFALMVFAILAGTFIVPVNLLISYAPEGYRPAFIYAGAAGLTVLYGLHLTRGAFIVNRLLASRPVHILLYICAVEIAPLLVIYRYVGRMIA